jgi:hypothetical protein
MQFVKQIPLSSISTVNTGDDGQDLDTIVSDLYAFANQMIAYHLAHQEAMQNIVLRKALERSKDLAPYSQKNKAA